MNDFIFSAEYAERRATVPKGIPLVLTLSGMNDPGGVVSQLDTYIWERCSPEEIVRFNSDLLLDYRARRPLITFDEDHLVDYSPEELSLSLCRDELGNPFLLLSGFEPDYRWEQFVETVLQLIAEFDVSITVWAHGIPMPVPHTRPLQVTVSGSRDDLIEARSTWKPTTKIPASVSHLLQYRLHTRGDEVVGFALLVPHYLAGNEYPDALLLALDSLMAATGLIFTSDVARDKTLEFRHQVDRQINENEESREMLAGLEDRYDAYMKDQGGRSPLIAEDGAIPTADQLGSELERFLAEYSEEPPQGDVSGD